MGPCPEAYRIRVLPAGIEVIGASPGGCFFGLQTLRQLLALHPASVPCVIIEDWPVFALRGLLHDVTRGKVPKVETLKRLIDRLAALKCNQLQLYIEHAFTFAFDPDICDAEHGLTPDEIRELDAYARERFITLVPAVATLGHMGRILSLPRYRHLAEVEATAPWEQMTWPQRARGFTIDVLNPESMRLVERIWGEVLEAFSSPVVNICGDEPHDLGRGKNAGRLEEAGRARAYVNRIADTCRFVQSHGRRVQMWSDVLAHYLDREPRASARADCENGSSPARIEEGPSFVNSVLEHLPCDLTMLHWGYDQGSRYDMTRRFVEAGFNTVVCPGTTGWKRILNAISLTERNITTFAQAGLEAGATGLLNTDWGDHGHFNALGCSAHGIALGAACAWSGIRESDGPDFDRRFARWILGTQDAEVVSLLRRAAAIADTCETWTLLRTPLNQLPKGGDLDSPTAWMDTHQAAAALLALLERPGGTPSAPPGQPCLPGPLDTADLRNAADLLLVLSEKMRDRRNIWTLQQTRDWSAQLSAAMLLYCDRWTECNKQGGLDDILSSVGDLIAGDL